MHHNVTTDQSGTFITHLYINGSHGHGCFSDWDYRSWDGRVLRQSAGKTPWTLRPRPRPPRRRKRLLAASSGPTASTQQSTPTTKRHQNFNELHWFGTLRIKMKRMIREATLDCGYNRWLIFITRRFCDYSTNPCDLFSFAILLWSGLKRMEVGMLWSD